MAIQILLCLEDMTYLVRVGRSYMPARTLSEALDLVAWVEGCTN